MTFNIYTLGCKVNSYESQAIREELLKDGFIETSFKTADLVIVNTCAVTSEAERKDRQVIRRIARENPNCKIVVMGCSSQIHKEDYLSLNNVVSVLGTYERKRAIRQGLEKDSVNKDNRHFSYEDMCITKGEHQVRAYIKIQDGCDNFCSYCIVPFARGNSRSRSKDSILKEASALLTNGVKEIVIGGIDTGSYIDPDDKNYKLKYLMYDLANLPFDDYRIRLSSIEESQIDDELISLFASNNKICPHFHIPLQSGSPKILKLMNRKYSLDDFDTKVEKIKNEVKNVALSTDVITGFPSETDEDFNKTYDLLKRHRFMRIHAFPYSERPLTRAINLPDKVEVSLRQERVRKLIALSDENEKLFKDSLKDETLSVLIEEKEGSNIYRGYSENYLMFELKSDENILGKFIEIKL